MPPCTVAIISDIHDSPSPSVPGRRGEYAQVLMKRAVHRLNRFVRPDVVAVLGDLTDDPNASDVMERLAGLKETLDLLDAPAIVLPGNHDPAPDRFYQVFERPEETVDIGGVRFLPFVDPEEPGFNARRTPEDVKRMLDARNRHDGPIVTLQHVPVAPPGHVPYGYTNADDVLQAMETAKIALAIGGHYHKGAALIRRSGAAYLCVRALCEAPFPFTVVRIEDGAIDVTEHRLQMPPELSLVDLHSHTQFAYCGRGMDTRLSPKLAELFGLGAMAFTEHSGQLYYTRPAAQGGGFFERGIETLEGYEPRIGAYWDACGEVRSETVMAGLEIDADFHGNLVIRREDWERADVRNGAVHQLPELRKKEAADAGRVADEFLYVMDRLVRTGIDIVVHPFRVFRRAKLPVPAALYDPVVRLLREHGVAAEINFHTNTPDPAFFRRCLDAGVKISFGSDAHEPYEVGEFAPHLQLLQSCGYDGDLADILWTPDRRLRAG